MTIDAGLLAESKQLMLALAPELSARPLYVLEMDQLSGLPCTGGCYGWAMNGLVMERPIIDRLGDEYEGPGPVVALDGRAITEACKPEHFIGCVKQVAIHEAAHLFPVDEIWEPRDTSKVRELQLAAMAKGFSMPELPAGDKYDPHDWRFIRRVCHLLFRSKLLGEEVPTPGIHKGHLTTSIIEYYLYELLAECVAMKDATIAAIEALTPPAGFMQIWDADLRYINWKRSQTEDHKCSTTTA